MKISPISTQKWLGRDFGPKKRPAKLHHVPPIFSKKFINEKVAAIGKVQNIKNSAPKISIFLSNRTFSFPFSYCYINKKQKIGFLKNTEILGAEFFICWTLPIAATFSSINFFEKMGGTWCNLAGHFFGPKSWPSHFWVETGKFSKRKFSEIGPHYG